MLTARPVPSSARSGNRVSDPARGLTEFGAAARDGGGRIRTCEGLSQPVYSRSPLTAWVPRRRSDSRKVGASAAARRPIGSGSTSNSA